MLIPEPVFHHFYRAYFLLCRLRDDEKLTLTPDHYEGGTIDQPTLMIKNSTRHDQGVYTCELGNKVGTQESNNAVYVAVYCELIVVLCNRKCIVSTDD